MKVHQPALPAELQIPLQKAFGTKSKKIHRGNVERTGKSRTFVPKERKVVAVTYTKEGVRTIKRENHSPKRKVMFEGRAYYVDSRIAEGEL